MAFTIRMLYKTELAQAYGISVSTLIKMIESTRIYLKKNNNGKDILGPTKGRRLLTIKQVTYITEHNGKPDE